MTHRSDNDWHGWPLQTVVERVAQTHYARMRETWPPTIHDTTPERLVDQNPNVRRQCMETALPSVVDVLDVINQMPHPAVQELHMALADYEVTTAMPDQAQDIAAADLIHRVQDIVRAYTNKEQS